MSEYLNFTLDEKASQGKKTQVWRVRATRDYALLGTIKWFGRWRQYTFFPEPGTIFNVGCLETINEKIGRLMQAREFEMARRLVQEGDEDGMVAFLMEGAEERASEAAARIRGKE